jgi:hypothetical protein
MSFLVSVEQDLQADATAALAAGKELLNYVDGVVTTDLLPALLTALEAAINSIGQEAVTALLGNDATPSASTPTTPPAT